MDLDEPIRIRVLREVFTDKTPTPATAASTGRRQSAADASATADLQANSAKIPPYALTVSGMNSTKRRIMGLRCFISALYKKTVLVYYRGGVHNPLLYLHLISL